MQFKIGDEITYVNPLLVGHYIVVSEVETDYWFQSKDFTQILLKHPAARMKLVESWQK